MIPRKFVRLLIGFLIILASIIFLNSDFFAVENYKIYNGEKINSGEIIPETQIKGTNIFHLDRDFLENYALKHPLIKEVGVRRQIPRTIVYNLVLREPVAWVELDEKFYIYCGEGKVIEEREKKPEIKIPEIKISGVTDREEVETGGEKFSNGLFLLQNLDSWVFDKVTEVSIKEPFDIVFELQNGARILTGQAYSLEELPKIISNFLEELEEDLDRLEYLDIRFEGRPVYKLR